MNDNYFVAPDAHEDPCIWRGEPNDSAPNLVVSRHEFRDPHLFDILAELIQADQIKDRP